MSFSIFGRQTLQSQVNSRWTRSKRASNHINLARFFVVRLWLWHMSNLRQPFLSHVVLKDGKVKWWIFFLALRLKSKAPFEFAHRLSFFFWPTRPWPNRWPLFSCRVSVHLSIHTYVRSSVTNKNVHISARKTKYDGHHAWK